MGKLFMQALPAAEPSMLSWVGVKSCLLEEVFCKSRVVSELNYVADFNHQCGGEQKQSQCDTFLCWWLSHFLVYFKCA